MNKLNKILLTLMLIKEFDGKVNYQDLIGFFSSQL